MSIDLRRRAATLQEQFCQAGALPVDSDVLLPAETLLDLYGEDIRARAYVTQDPSQGEMMLRPDFTVPVVQMHMTGGAEPARYTYAGKVFRRQEVHPNRAIEYFQVGFELFQRNDPGAADAEVFALVSQALSGLPVRAVTGDIGVLTAAVHGLDSSEGRKAALLRHLWQPRRFRALLDRYSGNLAPPPSRAALLETGLRGDAPQIGLRSQAEMKQRLAALRADTAEGPMAAEQIGLIDAVLAVKETAPFALEQLRDIGVDLPALTPALDRMEARLEALAEQGIAVDSMEFEASYGRTSMEYYDGFVFGFLSKTRADLPPIATGGRYDALTQRLGNGAEIPAVGAVIRPDLVALLETPA